MKIYKGRIIYEEIFNGKAEPLYSPELVSGYLKEAFNCFPLQEQFMVIPVSCKNHPLGQFMVTLGTANSTLVHPREIFQPVILSGASSLIVAHNHPSGDPTPSRADIEITRKLKEAAQILEINLLDHLITGLPEDDPKGLGYYSFSEAGLL